MPNGKLMGLMKDELGRKIMTKFVGLKAKTYNYLIDGDSKDKKAKDTKKCIIKRKTKFEHSIRSNSSKQLENNLRRAT